MDNLLAFDDQAVFVAERASGTNRLMQCGWVYNRAVNLEGLQRFHQNFGQQLLLSRRIQRSALPFGRHRWVASSSAAQIETAPARPRAEFGTWLRERACAPVDAEHGPGWHLDVLPFQDGGTGVSLVVSHSITDGVGLCRAVADAARGTTAGADWPAADSRRRLRTLTADAGQALRDFPRFAGALKTAARLARRVRSEPARVRPAPPTSRNAGSGEQLIVPETVTWVDLAQWDKCAKSLGGNSNALLAGFAAKLAEQLGRVRPDDGAVVLSIPVNTRTDGDTRANALTHVGVTVDPANAAADLRPIRTSIKQALVDDAYADPDRLALLPLIAVLPLWLAKRMGNMTTGSPGKVTPSNLGDLAAEANRPDGADADYFFMRWTCSRLTRNTVDRVGGILAMLSGRIDGRIFIAVFAYQPGQPNTVDHLRGAISRTLADFSLTGFFESDLSGASGAKADDTAASDGRV